MSLQVSRTFVVCAALFFGWSAPLAAQDHDAQDHGTQDHDAHADHRMYTYTFASGWTLGAMGQLFPLVTRVAGVDDSPIRGTEWVLTQNALMVNLESPARSWSLRFTPHFEAFTLQDGEITPGGWGEGFLDARHPHTFVHELMVSRLWRSEEGWDLGVSFGKGFAAYGSDDPMSRPVAKYPTNHHLAQILERYTVNVQAMRGSWIFEASVFAGNEPEGPFDMGNYEGFGNSFSGRVTHRTELAGGRGALELSGSAARVVEEHGGHSDPTDLVHGGVRWEGAGSYLLLEGAVSRVEGHSADGYHSVVLEGSRVFGPVRGYARGELASRPEYPRESGEEGFFRYEHHDKPVGATDWRTAVLGAEASGWWAGSILFRPFVEGAHYRAERSVGAVDPRFPLERAFTTWTLGVRIFPGGGPMRMGSYGLRDAMSAMLPPGATPTESTTPHAHH